MMHLLAPLLLFASCSLGRMVDDEGRYSTLFPTTPLSDAPCIEDQDCVITHLVDGQCCPGPAHNPSNLYTRDQFDRLVTHQAQICTESRDSYTCPEHAPAGHIDTVFKGMCIENRCLKRSVPAENPAAPPPPPPQTPANTNPSVETTGPTPTAASPSP